MSGGLAKGSICGPLLISKGLDSRKKIAVSISVIFEFLEWNLKGAEEATSVLSLTPAFDRDTKIKQTNEPKHE